MFDNYNLKARVYPVIILFFPIIVVGIFYSFHFQSVIVLLSSLGVLGALTYLFSQIGRDQGAMKQEKLWKSWGGSPTTQVLRFKDGRIDQHTKRRYHEKLQLLCPVNKIPDVNMENKTPGRADEVYHAWAKFLISKTRDGKMFPLLLKENISYGFRRNLWGLKVQAIFLITMLSIGNYIFWIIKTNSFLPTQYPDSFKYSFISLILTLIFWLLIVKRSWIKIPAFSYAERLLEALESF